MSDCTTGANTDIDVDVDAVRKLLADLGLTTYEAAVFVALQRLGVATADELATASGVPRSQVYGAAEGLSTHGLVHTHEGTPRRYRPVDVETTHEQLWEPFQRRSEQAFEALSELATRPKPGEDDRNDVWFLQGVPILVSDTLVETVATAVEDGVCVRILSRDTDILDRFDCTGASLDRVVEIDDGDAVVGRVLVVDRDAVLVSAYDAAETAIWSADTDVAALLVEIIESAVSRTLSE
jgi:sugar-specific transcriptional regulator TrmB